MYMKSDGNGGYVVSKSLLALILAIITILSVFASIVAYSVSARSDIGSLQKELTELKISEKEHSILADKVANTKADILVINTKLDGLKEDMAEVKELLKNG